jgi:putative DNA methylase
MISDLRGTAMPDDVWRSRGYLPHWDAGEVPQAITFRLADSLPAHVLADMRAELQLLDDDALAVAQRVRFERLLDHGLGEARLGDPKVADIVERAFLHFDGVRYRLHAWVIMPNHVHVVATPFAEWELARIVHGWKSYSATMANRVLGRTGAFWSREYFDRVIRDEAHYANAVCYTTMNPVKAGLCRRPEDWRFSSAWAGRRDQ